MKAQDKVQQGVPKEALGRTKAAMWIMSAMFGPLYKLLLTHHADLNKDDIAEVLKHKDFLTRMLDFARQNLNEIERTYVRHE